MKKSHIIILIFNLIYLIIFGTYYLMQGNYEFLLYIAVIVILGVIIGINLNKGIFDNLILWLLSIWGLAHMIGGGVRIAGNSVYSLRLIDIIDNGGQFYILKMDQLIHFYGFLVAAILVYQLLAPNFKNVDKSKLAIFL